jgi:hypothetical protein
MPSDSRPATRDRSHPLLDDLSAVAERRPRRSPAGADQDAERMVQVNVTLPASLKKRLGLAKLETGEDVKDLVQAAVAEYLDRLGFWTHIPLGG